MAEIAKIGRHTTLRGLARSLFPAREDGDGLRGAEEALLAANPTLATPAGFRAGAPVIVPTAPGGRAGRSENADTATPGQAHEEMARQLAALIDGAGQAFEAELAEAKAEAEALRSASVAGAIRKRFPDLADRLPEIAKAAAERTRAAKVRQGTLEQVFAQAKQDLASIGNAAPPER